MTPANNRQTARFTSFVALLLLTVMATSFSFAMGEGHRNMMLIYLMYGIPFVLLFIYPYFTRDELPLYLFFVTLTGCALINYSSFRVSAVMYTALFIISFMFYRRTLFLGRVSARSFFRVVRWLIIAYFLVLAIQQFCIVTGLPVFNLIAGGTEVASGVYKLNSLTPEPAHTARIITLLMFAYVKMRECFTGHKYRLAVDGRKDILIWFLFLYVLFFSGSSTAFIALPILFLYFLNLRNSVIFIVLMIVGLVLLTQFSDYAPLLRTVRLFEAVLQWDLEAMYAADHSGAMRIAPIVVYFDYFFDIFSSSFWIGMGMGANVVFSRIVYGVNEGVMLGGIFPSMLMNSGVIAFGLFIWVFRRYVVTRLFSYQTLLWLALFFPVGLNNYMLWLSFIVFMTINYFQKQYLPVKVK